MSVERRPVRLPGTMQVLERGWLSSNSIVFDEGDAISIVDTGYVSHAPCWCNCSSNCSGAVR